MKIRQKIALAWAALILILPAAVAQSRSRPVKPQSGKAPSATTKQPVTAPAVPTDPALETLLRQMDAAAEKFRSAQADFTWDQYQTVVDETDTQTGTIYFRRRGKETDMSADVKTPEPKHVLFTDAKLRLYQPKIDQVTEYDAGKNRSEFETFLVLGFGGRGHDLQRSFTVKFLKKEAVDGVDTAVLELVPTAPKVRNMFNRMLLWIDPARGVSLKQQFFEPSGDYRLARYSNFKLNQKLSDEAFKLKTTANTKVVSPQG